MSTKKILVINFGLGNLASLCNALTALNIDWEIASNIREVKNSSFCSFILPGVGTFDAGMEGLESRGFVNPIKEWANDGVPCLGICLGMQLLMSKSEESKKNRNGLGLIKGNVVSLPSISLPIPNIGWAPTFLNNDKNADNKQNNFFETLNSDFYYVHSYVAKPKSQNILAYFKYGDTKQTAAIFKENIFGVQFHPEKSLQSGLKLIKEFYLKTN